MQPLESLKALGDPIYESFYGLSEQPFAITTDPRFLYFGRSHQRAFAEVLNGIRRRESIILITGETGTGKTTLCRAVIEALGERTFSAMIMNPYMAGAEVFRIILRDFGLVTHEELRRGAIAGADVPQLLDTLEGFLRSLVPLGAHAIIVLDEAQSLTPQVLDQIRMLTALEHDGQRLVQIVLCGQPGLLATLKSEALCALSERITRRVSLSPLEASEVGAYIHHRLAIAGGRDAVRFEPEASRLVADLSRGLPRRVNVLCDRALQESRIEGASIVTPDLVKRAAKSLAGVHEPIDGPIAPAEPVMRAEPLLPLTFGGTAEATEARRGGRRPLALGLAVGLTALAAAAGVYGYQARNMIANSEVPEVTAPARDFGAMPAALPVPTAEDAQAAIDAMRRPPLPPQLPQLPDDRDQLD